MTQMSPSLNIYIHICTKHINTNQQYSWRNIRFYISDRWSMDNALFQCFRSFVAENFRWTIELEWCLWCGGTIPHTTRTNLVSVICLLSPHQHVPYTGHSESNVLQLWHLYLYAWVYTFRRWPFFEKITAHQWGFCGFKLPFTIVFY